MSTLREPNVLGAYLILPVVALTSLLSRGVKNIGLRHMAVGSLLIHLLAILLTFSRSAWLGTALAVLLVLWFLHKERVIKIVKRFWLVIAALLIVVAVGAFSLRETSVFQGYIIHTTELATTEHSSTELHFLLAKESLEDVTEQPIGYGPGTAGLASIRSDDGQLTENYYIQVMYEVGVVGFGLFVAINVVVYVRIWRRRDTFGFVLIASFWGYFITNMLLHTWANEAVAAQWWLLAGVAVAYATTQHQKSSGKSKDITKT